MAFDKTKLEELNKLQKEKKKEKKNRLILLKNAKAHACAEYLKSVENLKKEFKLKIDAATDIWQKKDLNSKLLDEIFKAKISRDYEIAKNLLTEKKQRLAKMKINKAIAFREYDHELKNARTLYKSNLLKIMAERKEVLNSLKEKQKSGKKNNNEVQSINKEYLSKIKEFENQITQNKILLENTEIQLKLKRDMQYEYELDRIFIIKRWWYGIGKELQRMSWSSRKKTLFNFSYVIVISLFISLLFLFLDFIITRI